MIHPKIVKLISILSAILATAIVSWFALSTWEFAMCVTNHVYSRIIWWASLPVGGGVMWLLSNAILTLPCALLGFILTKLKLLK